MRKLLHLVFAVWKSGQPFDPEHYPWQKPNHVPTRDIPMSANEQAAGHNPETEPEKPVVTAACSTTPALDSGSSRPPARPAPEAPWLDFAHLRTQLPLARVLEHLGLLAELRGRGSQRRGPCPVHAPAGQGRTFSVHLEQNVFHCFEASCGIRGDVIDLWAAVKQLPLREAAVDLVHTFGLEPAPPPARGTEKRHG